MRYHERRGGRVRAAEQQGREPAPPIRQPTWQWYIPIYFWAGGIAAGAWVAAAVEDFAGDSDRDVVRAGRDIALLGIAGGTALLIADLGRPERFLNMLRIVRPRSTMNLGSWGLTAFGACTGLAALLQAGEDGLLGDRPWLTRASRGSVGRAVHVIGLPLALFVGSYTGVLLGTTSTPSWARRVRLLGPLFATSAISSGFAAVSQALEMFARGTPAIRRRLARAESVALAAELALAIVSRRRARHMPSARGETWLMRLANALTRGGGMAVPLAMQLVREWKWGRERSRRRELLSRGKRRRSRYARDLRRERDDRLDKLSIISPALAMAGSLALRYLTTREGYRSARTPNDTWLATGAVFEEPDRRQAQALSPGVRVRVPKPRRAPRHEVIGRITIVQEDRIRVIDTLGRGYLLTVKKRRASAARLAQWRDTGAMLRIWYVGVPDIGARVERIGAVS